MRGNNDDNTPASVALQEGPPKLAPAELRAAQEETLAAPRRAYGLPAKVLFTTFDLLYGKKRTLSKFKVLELVARVPYQAWEQVAYIAITHVYDKTGLARRIAERVRESRHQQDNEQWHLLILEELIAESGKKENKIYFFWIPQAIALVYYAVSWLLFVLKPEESYKLNADFEDHAEHEYMGFVAENPHLETTPYDSDLTTVYGTYASQADLFRQIGHDERVHKLDSIERIEQARFS
ncbi:alternative oxidase [Granulicoccus phenolivorans]|uniref:alternative oxidase n=1 Tax=Granulicoccus phenolivorans TaxID=266854 RepID=UPI0003F6A7BC|nr:alternative oxidase [Granulicoccus phenolivorans]